MSNAEVLVEEWRGGRCESFHRGHAVVVDGTGGIVASWGTPDLAVYPRSSAKMLQALPLVESGAAESAGLSDRLLALACASHKAEAIHTEAVAGWLSALGREGDLRCGAHEPIDTAARDDLIRSGRTPSQIHNNCSGKHTGFLTLSRHLGGGPEYLDLDHPVQTAIKSAWEECCAETSPGFGIDGCSAPNHVTTLTGLARALAGFATAGARGDVRSRAQARLTAAMIAHPEMVRGERGWCTRLMRASRGAAAVKGGAEGVYAAILPGLGLGIAVKIEDGADRAKNIAMAAILAQFGLIDPQGTLVERPVVNRRGLVTGVTRPAAALLDGRALA